MRGITGERSLARQLGRRWWAAVFCLAALAVATPLVGPGDGVVSAAQAATTAKSEDGTGGRIPYYEDRFSREGFYFRDRLGSEYKGAYIADSGKYANGYSEFANVAAALVDPRGRSDEELADLIALGRPEEAPAYDFKLVSLEEWKDYLRPEVYEELRADGVQNLLMARAMSFPGVREAGKKTGLHSEQLIKNELEKNRNGKAALKPLSWYTDRGPCEVCGEEVIEDGTPVFYTQEYGLTQQEQAQRAAELKPVDAELRKIRNSRKQLEERAHKAAKLPAGPRANERRVIAKELKKVADREESAKARRDRIVGRYKDIYSVRADTARGNLRRDIGKAREADRELKSVFPAPSTDCPMPQAQSLGRPQSVSAVRPAAFSARQAADCGDAEEQPRGGLDRGLATTPRAPGGIDFSRLELRYLADPGSAGGGLRYAFKAPLAASGENDGTTGLAGAKESSDAFFTWLGLEPSTFWVNLNPNEPDRIVDSRLGRTDAGRVLLQADLQLKKTTGELIHPDTKLGARYWGELSGDCMSFRTWIVPAPATVHEDGDELYILKSPLDVQMETQYLKSRGGEGAVSCPQQSKSVQEHNEAVFRRLILPGVVKAVNTAPEYAELRRVYLSRVAAQWYRELSARKATAYGEMIDKGDIDAYTTREKWTPRDTFDAYVRSYTKGEFKVTHRTREGDTEYTRTYIYGGVDFTSVPFTSMPADRMTERWPTLTRDVGRSLAQPVTDTEQAQVWLGGGAPSTAEPDTEAEARDGGDGGGGAQATDAGSGTLRWWLPAAALLAGLLGLLALRRRGRRPRVRPAAAPQKPAEPDHSQWL
ncbi:hypothetical protein [Streptomyces sp. NBC_01092]|uniref:hypothetical protein n=1 Tax=Streptomyces sp. NBC_01092 TaxID=2903748 RepID=UPI00386E6C93|nr:hypothetical protein OG254_18115 [Streptomyces sp. NBC_01092]